MKQLMNKRLTATPNIFLLGVALVISFNVFAMSGGNPAASKVGDAEL